MKQSKLLRRISVAIVAGLLITMSVLSVTLAKYTSSFDGTATQSVAKWAFTVDGATEGQFNATVSVDTPTNTNAVAASKMAPGTTGKFSFVITNDSDVQATYTVKMTKTSAPTNVSFYYDQDFSKPFQIATETEYSFSTAGTTNDGALEKSDTTGETITVYWKWNYETSNGDVIDTNEGIAHSDMVITIDVVGTQVNPTVAVD